MSVNGLRCCGHLLQPSAWAPSSPPSLPACRAEEGCSLSPFPAQGGGSTGGRGQGEGDSQSAVLGGLIGAVVDLHVG